jgi:hypothetical protein
MNYSQVVEDDLKTAVDKASYRTSTGEFSIWPADHQGQKYLKIWFQPSAGGPAMEIMNVAVAERSSLVSQGVSLASSRTWPYHSGATPTATYYYASADRDKLYVYYLNAQGTSTAVGTWSVESVGKDGEEHERFVAVL